MKGTMSELELSLFRQRSQEALKQKARRGALFLGVAAGDLEQWLEPFVSALRHKTRARMCPAYIAGLIGLGGSQEHPTDGGARRRRQL